MGCHFRASPGIGQLNLPTKFVRGFLSHSRQMPRPPLPRPFEFIAHYTGWFRRKGQYFWRWYRLLWEKKFVWTCVEFWMVTEI